MASSLMDGESLAARAEYHEAGETEQAESSRASYSDEVETTEGSERKSFGFRMFTLADLNDLPEEQHQYLVEGLLPTGGSSILYDKPKRGKSTLARQLAVAVSQGKTFLGRSCVAGPVMYFALEEKLGEIREHFSLLGAQNGDPIVIIPECKGTSKHELLDAIRYESPALVIIDTLPKLLHFPKMNDYGPVNEAVRWMHDCSRATGAHMMGIMHAKKGREDDPMDNLLGSTAFAGGVDTLIALSRTSMGQVISTVQRYGTPLDDVQLHFDPETRSVSLGATRDEFLKEEKRLVREDLGQRIVQFVNGNLGCLESDIVSNVRGSAQSIKSELRSQLQEAIRREGSGKSGDPYRYYGDVPVEIGA